MEAQHIQPDLCTYVILLDGMCQNQEISDVFSFLRTVEDKGVIPDIITYAILINGFCKVGKLEMQVMFSTNFFQRLATQC